MSSEIPSFLTDVTSMNQFDRHPPSSSLPFLEDDDNNHENRHYCRDEDEVDHINHNIDNVNNNDYDISGSNYNDSYWVNTAYHDFVSSNINNNNNCNSNSNSQSYDSMSQNHQQNVDNCNVHINHNFDNVNNNDYAMSGSNNNDSFQLNTAYHDFVNSKNNNNSNSKSNSETYNSMSQSDQQIVSMSSSRHLQNNKISHDYLDFSIMDDSSINMGTKLFGQNLVSVMNNEHPNTTNCLFYSLESTKTKKNNVLFPQRLRLMLQSPLSDGAISWLPHGRSFLVLDIDRFVDLMGQYFNSTNFKSFRRQLNLWDFKRITTGPDTGAYYNQLFLRGMPNLAKRMSLMKKKGTEKRRPANVSNTSMCSDCIRMYMLTSTLFFPSARL